MYRFVKQVIKSILMSKLSIKINIAGRIYPMNIERKNEEGIRRSVKIIEDRLKFYQQNYAIKDKQDLLAMCLVEFAAKYETVKDKKFIDDSGIEDKLSVLDALISEKL